MYTRKRSVPTKEFAHRFGVTGETLRRNLSVNGHFLGQKPLKLPNGRLLWPDIHPEELQEKGGE